MRILLSEKVFVLLRGEGVYLATPEGKFAAGNLTVNFQRNVIYHAAWLAAYLVAVFNKILGTECLNGE